MAVRTTLLAILMLLGAQVARADYLDVITIRLTPECPLDRYMSVVKEFRSVIERLDYKYTVEISVPLMSNELDVIYWIGREPDLTTFGAETDRWEGEVAKGGTPEATIDKKLDACGENVSRSGHHTR